MRQEHTQEMEERFHGDQGDMAARLMQLHGALMDIHAETSKVLGYCSENFTIKRIHQIVDEALESN